MRYLSMFLLVCGLWGCGAAQPPAISDIRDDVVKVQGLPIVDNIFGLQHVAQRNEDTMKTVRAEAERGCLLYERSASNMLSVRCVQFTQGLLGGGVCVRSEYLFSCMKK